MIGLGTAFTAGMDGTPLSEISKPQFLYHIEVLTLTLAVLGAVSLYSIALWALTDYLRLTHWFPWSNGPLSNWMVWLGLAVAVNAVAANIRPRESWTRKQSLLFNRLNGFASVAQPEEQQTAGQLALGGK